MCVMKQGRSCTDAASTRAINQTEAAAETVQIGLISLAISRNQGARTGTGRERKIEWDREGEIRKWRITKITEASLLYRVFQYIQIDTCKYFDLCNRLPILRRHIVKYLTIIFDVPKNKLHDIHRYKSTTSMVWQQSAGLCLLLCYPNFTVWYKQSLLIFREAPLLSLYHQSLSVVFTLRLSSLSLRIVCFLIFSLFRENEIHWLWLVSDTINTRLGVTRWAGLQRWEVKSWPDRRVGESGQGLKDERGNEGWSWLAAVTVWDMDDPSHRCDRGKTSHSGFISLSTFFV